MKNYTIASFTVCIFVETVHNSQIEFILRDAEDRNGHEPDYYTDELDKMLSEAAKAFPTARFTECCTYGSYSVTLYAETLEELQQYMAVADKTIANWIAKYGINRMKKHD